MHLAAVLVVCTLKQYSIETYISSEVAIDVISGGFVTKIVLNNGVKIDYPELHRSRDNRFKVILGDICDAFIATTSVTASGVISGMVVECARLDDRAQFGCFRKNRS